MSDMNSPTFCVVPWIHLGTRPDGKLNLCCTASGEILRDDHGNEVRLDRHSVDEVWNCKSLRQAREAFANGRQVAGCGACYLNERNGKLSTRQRLNDTWMARLGVSEIQARLNESRSHDWQLKSQPVYLDLRLSNKCNLKCRMCFPVYSHLLAKEFEQIQSEGKPFPAGVEPAASILDNWSESSLFFENMDRLLPFCNEIYFAGGEPMLMRETEKILQMAVEQNVAQNIAITFHTNCTIWNPMLGELFDQFRAVSVNCSVKGVGDVDAYIRHPLNFSNVDKTFARFLQQSSANPRMDVRLAVAISWQSVFDLPDLAQWFCAHVHRFPYASSGLTFNLVNYPSFLSVKMIPSHLRGEAIQSVDQTIDILVRGGIGRDESNLEGLRAVKKILDRPVEVSSTEYQDLLSHTVTLDQLRGESLQTAIPKAYRVFEHYQTPFTAAEL